ncbi:MAG: von Willebrand factor type A domain-containing protein [Verrucomicrobiae bacterium]
MNDDENGPQAWIDPALEARVVASVLGESSAFESEELERILEENPELAIFHRRIEAVHALVGAVIRPEMPKIRMAADRRQKLLETIGGRPEGAERKIAPLPYVPGWQKSEFLSRLAACLVIGGILALLSSLSLPAISGSLVKASRSKSSAQSPPDFVGESAGFVGAEAPASPASQVAVGFIENEMPLNAPVLATADSLTASAGSSARNFSMAPMSVNRPALAAQAPPPSEAKSRSEASQRGDRGSVAMSPAAALPSPPSKAEVASLSAAPAQASNIKAFTGGWGKGSGSGTGARAREDVADSSVGSDDLKDSRLPAARGAVREEKQLAMKAASDSLAKLDRRLGEDTDSPAAGRKEISKAKKARSETSRKEIPTATQPFSTFSLHVSDVSFQLAKDALARGGRPDPARIRPEEFYNAFDYGDPSPAGKEEVACRIEQCAHPFLQQRNLVRIALRVAASGRAAAQPLRLTILLDTSGSMEREDRAASVRRALQALAGLLGPNDRVTLIGFARTPRLLAEQVPGNQAGKLVEIAARTPSEGGTNLEQALALASELALKQFLPAAQNRVVLITDGAANLGNANPVRLGSLVEKSRQQGISFDACGVGAKGANDEVLESLTRQGDGRYYFLNSPEEADAGFARQLAGAFRPAAENVKVQVVFNPERVSQYRLIGFEKHLLKKEDFRDDKVAAAELAAEEAGVALYQVETLPKGEGDLGEVFVRFRDPANGRMVERSWTMPYDARAAAFDKATQSMQLAGTAALLAEKLQGNQEVDLKALAPVLTGLRGHYSNQARVRELINMFQAMRP